MPYRWSHVDQNLIDKKYNELKDTKFPAPKYNKKAIQKDILAFKKYSEKASLSQGDIIKRSFYGSKIIHPFHPHRWKERTSEDISITEAWKDPYRMKRAIRLTIADGREPTNKNIASTYRQYKLGRVPAIFFPAQSLEVIKQYSKEGDIVLDPFIGYGGSLPAAAVSKRKIIGIDISRKSIAGNKRLARDLVNTLKLDKSNIELIKEDSRKALNKLAPNSIDLVYTSPPYYNRELYSGRNQSHKLKSYEQWLKEFYIPSIKGISRAVKPNKYILINVAPVKESGKLKYPLDIDTQRIATNSGLKYIGQKKLALGLYRRGVKGKTALQQKYEPILVFKKKSIRKYNKT
ncbi:MAG: DNA methyltransferase [Nanoarchaeota archaeon]